MYRCCLLGLSLAVSALLLTGQLDAQNVTGYDAIPEPLLFLVREPAVHAELQLTKQQHRELTKLNSQFDADLLASRLWPAEKSASRFAEVLAATRKHLAAKLDKQQQERLQQIGYRTRGIGFVLLPDAAQTLALTDKQRLEIEGLIRATQEEISSVQKELSAGKRNAKEANQTANDLQVKQQRDVLAVLTSEQQQQVVQLVGSSFDLNRLGQVSFKAPELVSSPTWINSKPLMIADLKGKVVALHFWTFGCHNCIQNYPWYKQWYQSYNDKGLVILGIHTPETAVEHEVDRVKAKVAEEKFRFPIVVDNEMANWQAWGNSMWPSVYLIDKQGRVRYWWYGELNWQGAGGQEIMAKRIEELMAEAG
ncbi:MAG: redoxin domain-containing protein [Planctomycetales bacterium]|nr:redoxin domain-containing protein [Planctomycetales bacterium]MCA9168540.1 redoxin domain-containing protein [Planctomycetales bacterium]